MATVRFAVVVFTVFGAHLVAAYHAPLNFTSEYCIECGTARLTRHTRDGTSINTHTSAFYDDLLSHSHEHRWALNCMGDDHVLACG
jgi:hypothetical protein